MATQSYFTPMPSFSGDEWNNRQAWAQMPKTADMRVLDQTYKRSKAAHDLLMQAQAQEAEIDNQILNTATPDEMANLFGQPRTEREARLQKIVQKDADAKTRGVRLIPNELQKLAYGQKLANLERTRLANYLDPLQFNLQQQNFAENQTKNARNWWNQQAGRTLQQQQLTAAEAYRKQQKEKADADRALRGFFGAANFNQRQQFHGDTQANQGLSQLMQMERMLQDNAEAAQRQKNFEAQFNRGYFGSVARAADVGALPPDQLSQFASRFDPATMKILEGYARIGAAKNQNAWTAPTTATATASPGYLSQFGNLATQIPNPSYGLAQNQFSGSAAAQPLDTPIDWGADGDGVDDEEDFGGDVGGGYAPAPMAPAQVAPSMAARPQANQNVQLVPPNMRGNYVEGQEYPARNNTVWRYTNGQMVRIR